MWCKSIVIIALCGGLAACDVATHRVAGGGWRVAVVGPNNTIYRGTATATLFEGGWFQDSNGLTTCQGRYSPGGAGSNVTFPVRCTNGLSGIRTASYQSGLQCGGQIVMQDGMQWQFIFRRGALNL
ncbi:hypothetical protein OAN307_c41400 [Octadecabacter antarcticus 307]|uniref:Uncharacterized protein n=1 Tax=Octadecabacter antarcticus 307 TaxID=391626 RepID=M9RCQ8_9RHOB|nr:hypothetical protein [Octadecabacter antarcticus]AGI69538.1 hypothetical protein OAN307_c41400 [Octadecabacter antarcticus 307]